MSRIFRFYWFVCTAVAALAVVSVPSPLSDSVASAATVRSVSLPGNLGFTGFAVTQTGVSVIGSIQAGSGIAGDCDLAPLTTDPLGVGQTTFRSCADPALWGEPVAVFQSLLLPSYNQALHAARRVNGEVRLGPVLATYQSNSGSHPVSAYGAGSLWIYEQQGPHGATIFRVSLTTGVLQAVVRVPELTRPYLVADDDGAWLIPAGSFGAATDTAIYHLSLANTIVSALKLPGYGHGSGFAAWAVAAGHAVYADLCRRPIAGKSCTLYALSGPSARPMFSRPSPADVSGGDCALAGSNGVYVLDEPDIASRNPPPRSNWRVERVDTSTGATPTVAVVTLPEFWDCPNGTGQPDAVIADGTLLLLASTDGATAPVTVEEARW
jgi:hypothetical protein